MKDPIPRSCRRDCERQVPRDLGPLRRFAAPKPPLESLFYDVMSERRSSRSLSAPDLVAIGELLWYTMRIQETRPDGTQHRLSPSAGGLHPIDVLLARRRQLYWYDAMHHGLRRVSISTSVIKDMYGAAHRLLPDARGDLLVLAGHVDVTSSKYLRATSLLWRDAGCVLQSIYLAAAWLELGVCGLGLLGDDTIAAAYSAPTVIGAGMCVIGRIRA